MLCVVKMAERHGFLSTPSGNLLSSQTRNWCAVFIYLSIYLSSMFSVWLWHIVLSCFRLHLRLWHHKWTDVQLYVSFSLCWTCRLLLCVCLCLRLHCLSSCIITFLVAVCLNAGVLTGTSIFFVFGPNMVWSLTSNLRLVSFSVLDRWHKTQTGSTMYSSLFIHHRTKCFDMLGNQSALCFLFSSLFSLFFLLVF